MNIFSDSQPSVVERAPQPPQVPVAEERVDVEVEEVSPVDEEEEIVQEVSISWGHP
jgi:hypothetical protein